MRKRPGVSPWLRVSALCLAVLCLDACSGAGSHPAAGVAGAATAGASASATPRATTTVAASTALAAPAPALAGPGSGSPAPRRCWPIVLLHGAPGFRSIGPVDYFYDVPRLLRAHGFEVYVPDVSGDTIAERARKVRDQLLATYPDPRVKVNLIAHSAAGLDARYLVSTLGLGTKVASLTTLGTPHRGCAINDLSLALLPAQLPAWLDTIAGLIGFDRDPEFTTGYLNGTFGPANPDDARVAYFSWAGSADPGGQTTGCAVDPLFLLSWLLLENTEGPNDGVVSVASARWGAFEGVLPADHLNLIGQPLGFTAPGFDHRTFYETWAETLERRGLGP